MNDLILYTNTTQLRTLISVGHLDILDFHITDDFNREIDFNNVDWYLTIQLDIFYYPSVKTTTFRDIVQDNNNKLLESMADE